ncbi:stromelysin-2-like [Branchiostoma floridae x Branchiostoma japonicum]
MDRMDEAIKYLEYYGYLKKTLGTRPEEEVKKAIEKFQTVVGLPANGELDDATFQKMTEARCLRSDPAAMTDPDAPVVGRIARYRIKWNKRKLTYRIKNYTPDLPEEQVDDAVRRGLQVWSNVTPLVFEKTSAYSDIEMSFEQYGHGDEDPLDGPGGTLAHAFFPGPGIGGDVHFDDSETWTVRSFRGTNLFIVAAHELGHSLGLDHSDVRGSLMFPIYQGYTPNFKLHKDDIKRIQNFYGKKPSRPPVVPRPEPENPDESGSNCCIL